MAGPRNATTTARGRVYKWRDEEFDSVTTILNGGIPKGALTNWAAKTVAEWTVANLQQVNAIAATDTAAAVDMMKGAPNRTRDAAAAKGSDIHAAVEAYVLGQPQPEWPKEVGPSMSQFQKFLDEFQPTFELSEASVYNREFSYAGTLDGVVTIGSQRLLIDVKTGRGIYGDSVAPQLAAYRRAAFIGMPDNSEVPMPEVDSCAVLHLRPQSYQLVPVIADDAVFRMFLYAKEIHKWCKSGGRETLLAPASPADFLEAVKA